MNKNVNRDYLVKVNVKTAEIETPKDDMIFYITDIMTSNIFFQLVFNESNGLINSYAPNEDSSNYSLTLRVVKPNDEPKEIEVVTLHQDSNFYVADLTGDFTDMLGIYECELFIDTTINGRQERNTTESFTYEVKKSIFTNLGEVIEGDPDYPLLIDTLATKEYVNKAVENMDIYGYATRDYVNQVVIGGDIDLSQYVTDQELAEALANVSGGGNIDLSQYVTDEELTEALVNFSGSGNIDLSWYVNEDELSSALLNKSDTNHTHSQYLTDEQIEAKNYATKDEIPTTLPANGGNADTVGGYSIWVGTETEYYALTEIKTDMMYFIEDDV